MNKPLTQNEMTATRALAGRVSVITGSTSGIGLGIARALAAADIRSQFRARNIARIRELLAAPLLYSTNLWLIEDAERQARLNRRIRTAAQRILLHYRFEIGASSAGSTIGTAQSTAKLLASFHK
jgi:NADP-dependent 3-hydroxy acid dehydrogenase YdfG